MPLTEVDIMWLFTVPGAKLAIKVSVALAGKNNNRLSPLIAPRATMDQSPSSSKLYLAGSEREEDRDDSTTTKSIIVLSFG